MAHRETGEPLAALAEHGQGRVCVCATPPHGFNLLSHLHPLLGWLSDGAAERPGRDIPAEIGPRPRSITVQGLRMICDEPVAHRADQVARLARRFDDFMTEVMGEGWQAPKVIELLQACTRHDPWDDGLCVSGAGGDCATAYSVAYTLGLARLWRSYAGELLLSPPPERTLPRHLAIRFIERLGYEEQPARLREIGMQLVDRADPSRTEADLARVYSATQRWHPKGMWLLAESERRYGDDFLSRVFEAMPKKRDEERLPGTFAWNSDRAAYYMSLAAGEDISGWPAEIGTTVHPLPPVPPDDEGFEEAMRSTLIDGLMAAPAAGSPSRRLDALTDLVALKREDRGRLPRAARKLVETFERAWRSDPRAEAPLRELAEGEAPQAAVAAMQLVSSGHADAADRLMELLPDHDVRFKLMAGHVLRKIGREVPELSLGGIERDRKRVGGLDVVHRDLVEIHPKVEGYEVANVICHSGLAGFPHGNVATRYYVYWVHTSPQWRRSGLSRLAFRAAMEHEDAQRCSTFALDTGTRNNAHALYRDFGFVDMDRRERATMALHQGIRCTPPEGVAVRPMKAEDCESVRRLLLDCHAGSFSISPLPVPMLCEGTWATLAEKDGEMIGAALAGHTEGDEARVIDVAVKEGTDAGPEIGVAMMARLHALPAQDGAKTARIEFCSDPGLLTDVLCRCGYARQASGGVNMFGIRDLSQLFGEIAPLYERRLADSEMDWSGRVILLGQRLRSSPEIEAGEVHVIEPEPGATDIVLRTTDEVITRVVTGRDTPLEGYLQRVTDTSPRSTPRSWAGSRRSSPGARS